VLGGEYCAACGQRALDPDPTVREFAHELAGEFLHWDSKLGNTFRLLVTRPGALTLEYLAGRRVRYISPLRLYLTCSVLFFFLSAVAPSEERGAADGAVRTNFGSVTRTQKDSVAAERAEVDSVARVLGKVGAAFVPHFRRAMRSPGEVSSAVARAIPKTMFALVPMFAALVMLVFRSRRRRYPQHLAFALHLHAFLYLALTLMLVTRFTSNAALYALVQLPLLTAIAVYFVGALRNVYGGSRKGAVARASLIAGAYSVVFLVAMVVTFGLIVLLEF
jgi:hypothetical protein